MAKPTSSPRIHSVFSALLLTHAEKAGADVAALKRRFSLPEPAGAMPGMDVTPETVRQLSDAVESALGDPFLGLHVASALPRGFFDVFEFAGRSAPTFAAALTRLVRYSVTVSPEAVYTLTNEPNGSVLSHRIQGDPLAVGRHANEFSLALIVTLCRHLIDRPWGPRRVSFSHPAPADHAELGAFFGTSAIEFGCAESSLYFDRDALDAPLSTADPTLLLILDRYAQALLPAQPGASTVKDQVRRHLRDHLTGGPLHIDAVAEALRMSSRTLQRRLTAQGTSFAEVLDELRRHLSRIYLDDPKLSLGEVAFLLGYSDVGAFVRAFKGWNGTTPGRYRSGAR